MITQKEARITVQKYPNLYPTILEQLSKERRRAGRERVPTLDEIIEKLKGKQKGAKK